MIQKEETESRRRRLVIEDIGEVFTESIGIALISSVLFILIVVGITASEAPFETSWFFRLRVVFFTLSLIFPVLLMMGFYILPGAKFFEPALALPIWLGFVALFFLLYWLKHHMRKHVLILRVGIIVLLVCMGLGYYFFVLPHYMVLPHTLSFD